MFLGKSSNSHNTLNLQQLLNLNRKNSQNSVSDSEETINGQSNDGTNGGNEVAVMLDGAHGCRCLLLPHWCLPQGRHVALSSSSRLWIC